MSLRIRIACLRWSVLPPILFFLIASPILRWAFGSGGRWFTWPNGADGWWRWKW